MYFRGLVGAGRLDVPVTVNSLRGMGGVVATGPLGGGGGKHVPTDSIVAMARTVGRIVVTIVASKEEWQPVKRCRGTATIDLLQASTTLYKNTRLVDVVLMRS